MKWIPNVLTGAAALLLSLGAQAQEEPIILVENGKSKWHIEALDDSVSFHAARFLQEQVRTLTGCTLPIGKGNLRNAILIGNSEEMITRTDDWSSAFDHEGTFALELRGSICIGAMDPEDILIATRDFVSGLPGVDMLAPGVFMHVPQQRLRALPDPYDAYIKPAFAFRMAFYHPATNADYSRWHLLRPVIKTRDSEDPEWGLWVHTMHRFVPHAQFETHPKYFAERNGVRVPDQLCLSNPEVLRITVDSLRAMMVRKPAAKYWSVSQMDNFNHCQCALCHRTDSIEGAPSGSILRFANAVADSFPDKVISTLAYQYSRTAPKFTKPRPNVNIMLCSIEEDRSRPIATRDQPGSFTADLREWSTLTHNIIVWDYVINFSHLVMPFPNWKVLAPNLQLFRDNGVPMMFEQGLSSPGGEMPEFRTYLLAKLLWNPDLNVDSLRWRFIDHFYGDAGVYIDKYTHLLEEELDKSGKPLTLYEHPQAHKDGYLSPENIAKYKMLFNSAEAAVMDEDTIYQWRVEDARLGIMYAELEIARAMPHAPNGLFEKDSMGNWHAKPYYEELLNTFVARAKKHGHRLLHETRLTPDEYLAEFSAHLKNGALSHLAVGKTISFETPPDARYPGGGPDALIDGFTASTNYQFGWQGWYGNDMVATIDLGEARFVQSVKAGFLHDQQSWIFLPTTVSIEYSADGSTFKTWGTVEFTDAGKKITLGTRKAELTPWDRPVSARYIRIKAKNLGDLPAWHGGKGHCWLFCDEIEVYGE
ncbi:MAG: DUF4838 domain-containing protein [Flavobacteriales bacterium]|nr:DUF4838 domain-containing protein [Flavobacteriales bacterium]